MREEAENGYCHACTHKLYLGLVACHEDDVVQIQITMIVQDEAVDAGEGEMFKGEIKKSLADAGAVERVNPRQRDK